MNDEHRIPTLDPELIVEVRKQVRDWSAELEDPPWIPSPAAKTLARGLKESCPRMATALEDAGILEPWAEMLHDRIWDLRMVLKDAGMTPSEAESQARMELIPSNPVMEAEWLATYCTNHEPMRGEDGEDGEDSVLLIEPWELDMVRGGLTKALRMVLARPMLPASDVMRLGAVLWLIERLPEHHDDCTAVFGFSKVGDSGSASWIMRIDEDGMTLTTSESIYGSWGSDHESETVMKVTRDGSSLTMPDLEVEDWLADFVKMAIDPTVNVTVEWASNHPMPDEEGDSISESLELHQEVMENESNNTQLLRKKFSTIFASVWTDSPTEVRESAQQEIDQTLKTDTAMDWTVEKLGYLPKFPTTDKGAMEREAMEILTAFQIEIPVDCCPTLKEAMADPQEHLLSMATTLCMGMDPLEGERD